MQLLNPLDLAQSWRIHRVPGKSRTHARVNDEQVPIIGSRMISDPTMPRLICPNSLWLWIVDSLKDGTFCDIALIELVFFFRVTLLILSTSSNFMSIVRS